MSLYCFSNFSFLAIRISFFLDDKMDEYYLYSDMDIVRAKYANIYEILSIELDDDYIHITLYNPSEYYPM